MLRRDVLKGMAVSLTAGALAAKAKAAEVKEFRVGYQKAGMLTAVKQRQTLETALKPLGVSVKWAEFAFGPPILEGINTGNLDFGFTGDAPPVFAQAASANVLYAASLPGHTAEGVLVPQDSSIKTLADLKGKKVGFGKASSAHTTVLFALEKAGLTYADIQPVYLPPADAAAAFSRGSIDSWAIWDPYFALAERSGARTLTLATDIHHPNQFFLANKTFANEHPDVLTKVLDALAGEIKWASTHRDEIAQAMHDASGIDLEGIKLSAARANYTILPISDETIENQQDVADRFLNLKLLPKRVVVRDLVWKWTPSA